MVNIATLLVDCLDRRGLVAALAQVLYGHGANILDSDQHSDPEAGQFFQRLRFDLSELHTDRHTLRHAIGEVAHRFKMNWTLYEGGVQRVGRWVSAFPNHTGQTQGVRPREPTVTDHRP